jgi:hypothetical protein
MSILPNSPWRSVPRRYGYSILDSTGGIVVNVGDGSSRPGEGERRIAAVIAALPGIVEVLREAEGFFGDLPAGTPRAEALYHRILAVMTQADITIVDN